MMPEWKKNYKGVESMTVAVMGCVVNGPGESKAANIGISLPGTGEAPTCPVYIDGRHVQTLRGSYEELDEALISSWAKPTLMVENEEERPEYKALIRLVGEDKVVNVIFFICNFSFTFSFK